MDSDMKNQGLIALLPKSFEFTSNDSVLRRFRHQSVRNQREDIQDQKIISMKKYQESKLKQLIKSKNKITPRENTEKQFEYNNQDTIYTSKPKKQDNVKTINLNMIHPTHKTNSKLEQKDTNGQNFCKLKKGQSNESQTAEESKRSKTLLFQTNKNQIVKKNDINIENNSNIYQENSLFYKYQVRKKQLNNMYDFKKYSQQTTIEQINLQQFDNSNSNTNKSSEQYTSEFTNVAKSPQQSPTQKIKTQTLESDEQKNKIFQLNTNDQIIQFDNLNINVIDLKIEPTQYKRRRLKSENFDENYKFMNKKCNNRSKNNLLKSNNQSAQNGKEQSDQMNITNSQTQEYTNNQIFTKQSFYDHPLYYSPIDLQNAQNTTRKNLNINIRELFQISPIKINTNLAQSNNNSDHNIEKNLSKKDQHTIQNQDEYIHQQILKKKKEATNKIYGLLNEVKQQNIFKKMVNKSQQILLTGDIISSFSNAYKSQLGKDNPLQTQIEELEHQSLNNNYIKLNNTITTEVEKGGTEKRKQVITQNMASQYQNNNIETQNIIVKTEPTENYICKTPNAQFSSTSTKFQNSESKDANQKIDLFSINKISIQPRTNFKSLLIQKSQNSENSPTNNTQNIINQESTPTSPARFSTPKNFKQKKNTSTPYKYTQHSQRYRSNTNFYQSEKKCFTSTFSNSFSDNKYKYNENDESQQKKNNSYILDQIFNSDKIDSWNVNENYETMSPLIERKDIFFA